MNTGQLEVYMAAAVKEEEEQAVQLAREAEAR
jgi:hypothetical protein